MKQQPLGDSSSNCERGDSSGEIHLLLLSLVFAPDGGSTANLLTDLMRGLAKTGIRVSVVTTTPHNNRDPDSLSRQPLKRRWPRVWAMSRIDGIRVYHVRVPRKRPGLMNRLIAYSLFHSLGLVLAVTAVGRTSVILAPSPPLTTGLAAWFLAKLWRRPFIYNVQEIYPDVAIGLGVFRNPVMIRALERLERFIYRRADATTVISESFRQSLEARAADPARLRIIPNFVDTEFIRPGPKRNAFAEEYGLADHFVVLYSGNVGLTQDWDGLLEVASRLRDEPRTVFAVVGDGVAKRQLDERVQRERLDNVVLIPYQPKSRVPEIYTAGDVCVIPMKEGTTMSTFPSKVYAIMAAGRPVIASADPGSELAELIASASCGWHVATEDPDALEAAIREAMLDPDARAQAGAAGRRYVEDHHSPEAASARYAALIRELATGEDPPAS